MLAFRSTITSAGTQSAVPGEAEYTQNGHIMSLRHISVAMLPQVRQRLVNADLPELCRSRHVLSMASRLSFSRSGWWHAKGRMQARRAAANLPSHAGLPQSAGQNENCTTPLLFRALVDAAAGSSRLQGLRGRQSLGCSPSSRGASQTTPRPLVSANLGNSSGILRLALAQPTRWSPGSCTGRSNPISGTTRRLCWTHQHTEPCAWHQGNSTMCIGKNSGSYPHASTNLTGGVGIAGARDKALQGRVVVPIAGDVLCQPHLHSSSILVS